MAIREIVYVPEPVLRRKAHKVTDFGPSFQQLVDDMVDTMRDAPGVGLAAPQIGVDQRVVVIENHDDDDDPRPPKLYVLVNPEIVQASEEKVIGVEGCLSVPGLVGEVSRHVQITVKAQNRRGQTIKVKVSDWVARIFQHEIDHLDGVLYTDLATRVWKPSAEEEELIKD